MTARTSRSSAPGPARDGRRALALGATGALIVCTLAWWALDGLIPADPHVIRVPRTVDPVHPRPGVGPELAPAHVVPEAPMIAHGVRGSVRVAPAPVRATHAPGSAPEDTGSAEQGTARAAYGDGIGDAEVVLALVDADGLRELGTVRSGPTGRYALEADLTAEIAGWTDAQRRGARLTADVRAGGHQPHHAERSLADLVARAREPGILELDLVLEAGQALHGRVVDEQGRPRPGAIVELVIPSFRAGVLGQRVAARVESGQNGGFALGFLSGGTHALRVRSEGFGSALLEQLELLVGYDRELGDVVVHGAGVLAGTAVHSDGSAAAFLELWAVPEELAFDGAAMRRDPARRAVLELEGHEGNDGLRFARMTTDETGRFRATGLRAGRYGLVLPHAARPLEPAGVAYATPSEALRILVPGTRLVVRVVDAEGNPASGTRVACARAEPDGEGGYALSAHQWEGARGATSTCAFDVEPDATYALRAVRGTSTVEDLVVLAPAESSHAVTLVLPGDRTGSLRFALSGPRGDPVRRARVSLTSALLGEPVDGCSDREIDGQGSLENVPAGRYVLSIAAVVDEDPDALLLPEAVRAELEIRSGATTEFARSLPFVAGLTLVLELGGPPPAGFELQVDPRTHPDQALRDRTVHEAGRGAVAQLRSAAGPARTLAFVVPPAGPHRSAGVSTTLLPGRTARVSGALVPGEYVLAVEAPGFAPVEQPLVLRAGERTEARVTLRTP